MLPKVRSYTFIVKEKEIREMIESAMDEFIQEVAPKMEDSERQVIHGDLNSQNIVCQKDDQEWRVSAIIDFGDSHLSYPLYEIAICMFYTMLDCKQKELDHFLGSAHALAGYVRESGRTDIDYKMLKKSITARLCQSYVLGLYNSTLQPENHYISDSLQLYPQLLADILKKPTLVIKEIWSSVIKSYESDI